MINIQVLAKAEVLGLPVDAAYQKNKDGSSEMIVFGAVATPKFMTVTELLTELGKLVTLGSINEDTIKNALPDGVAKAMDKIKFSVKVIYFRKGVPAPSPDGTVPAAQKGSEFAFDISVDLAEITAGFPIEVQDVSFKIWSTANSQILQEMDITRINKLLGKNT